MDVGDLRSWVRLPWLAHDGVPGPYIMIPQYQFKGGPEPLEKESNKFLGSKHDDRFSNPFFEMVPKTCQGSFFVPALER